MTRDRAIRAKIKNPFPAPKRYCALGVLAANLHKLGNVLQEKARELCKKSRKAA